MSQTREAAKKPGRARKAKLAGLESGKVERAAKPTSSMMHFRVDNRLKRDAASTLESIGMSVPEAVRLFLRRVVIEKALPLRLEAPNATTRAAMAESLSPDLKVFKTAQELFDDLKKGGVR